MSIYVPLISALLGALIGAAASVGTVLVQSSAQNKRERRKDAVQLALEDWKTRVAIITKKGTGAAPPLSVFVHYHARIVELAETGKLTPQAIRDLDDEQVELIRIICEVKGAKSGSEA